MHGLPSLSEPLAPKAGDLLLIVSHRGTYTRERVSRVGRDFVYAGGARYQRANGYEKTSFGGSRQAYPDRPDYLAAIEAAIAWDQLTRRHLPSAPPAGATAADIRAAGRLLRLPGFEKPAPRPRPTHCGACDYEEADGELLAQCPQCKAADAAKGGA